MIYQKSPRENRVGFHGFKVVFDFEEKAEGLKFCSILQGLYDCSTKVKQKYLSEPYFNWFFHTTDVVFLI